jgi:transcriptional regulator with XRE-family HTH domain
MQTLKSLSIVLNDQRSAQLVGKSELADSVGINRVTMSRIFSGDHNFSVSTLLALADRLDLELALVPKSVAGVITDHLNAAVLDSQSDFQRKITAKPGRRAASAAASSHQNQQSQPNSVSAVRDL